MKPLSLTVGVLFLSVCFLRGDTNAVDPQTALEIERLKLEQQKVALETAKVELEKQKEELRLEEMKEAQLEAATNALQEAAIQIKRVYTMRFAAITNACRRQTELSLMDNGKGARRDAPKTQQITRDGQTVRQVAYKFDIRKYLTALAKMDTSKCPADFQQAFYDYVITWQKKSDYSVLSFARDAAQTATSLKPAGGSGVAEVAKRSEQRDTSAAWAEVQKTAIKYGVGTRRIKMDLVDGLVGKDINWEYDFWLDSPPARK